MADRPSQFHGISASDDGSERLNARLQLFDSILAKTDVLSYRLQTNEAPLLRPLDRPSSSSGSWRGMTGSLEALIVATGPRTGTQHSNRIARLRAS